MRINVKAITNATSKIPQLHERKRLNAEERIKIFSSAMQSGCKLCKGQCCGAFVPLGISGDESLWPLFGLSNAQFRSNLFARLSAISKSGVDAARIEGEYAKAMGESSKPEGNPKLLHSLFSSLYPSFGIFNQFSSKCILASKKTGCILGNFKPSLCWRFFCSLGKHGLSHAVRKFTPYELLISQSRKFSMQNSPDFMKIISKLGQKSIHAKIFLLQNPAEFAAMASQIENVKYSIITEEIAEHIVLNGQMLENGQILLAPKTLIAQFAKKHDSSHYCYSNADDCSGKPSYNLNILISGDIIQVE